METEQRTQQIRALISANESAEAIRRTRQLLTDLKLEATLVQLDLIESEANNIIDQQINGLLSIDDHMRLQSVNRAKLMKLLLGINGEGAIAKNLEVSEPNTQVVSQSTDRQNANNAFKDGLKNVIGIGLLLPAMGAFISQNWAVALCFTVAGLVSFIPSLVFIEKTIRYQLLSWQKYLILFGALLLAGAIYTPKKDGQTNPPPLEKNN